MPPKRPPQNQRLTVIENALKHSAELHAQHVEDMREIRDTQKELQRMHKNLTVAVIKIAESQRATDQKLNSFIDWVKKYLQGRGGNGRDRF